VQHAGVPLSLKSAGTLQIGKFSISADLYVTTLSHTHSHTVYALPAFNPQQLSPAYDDPYPVADKCRLWFNLYTLFWLLQFHLNIFIKKLLLPISYIYIFQESLRQQQHHHFHAYVCVLTSKYMQLRT
jgi:hypothetical protein